MAKKLTETEPLVKDYIYDKLLVNAAELWLDEVTAVRENKNFTKKAKKDAEKSFRQIIRCLTKAQFAVTMAKAAGCMDRGLMMTSDPHAGLKKKKKARK